MTIRIPAITPQIRVAFAQFDLLGFVPELNAQTNNIIEPTNGIDIKNIVNIHSPVFIGGKADC